VSSVELMKLVDIDVDRNNLPEYIRDICEENQQYDLLEMNHQAMLDGDKVNTEFWDITYNCGSYVTFIKVLYRPWDKYYPIDESYVTVSHDRLNKIMEMIK
jgi:hypothetical protein